MGFGGGDEVSEVRGGVDMKKSGVPDDPRLGSFEPCLEVVVESESVLEAELME